MKVSKKDWDFIQLEIERWIEESQSNRNYVVNILQLTVGEIIEEIINKANGKTPYQYLECLVLKDGKQAGTKLMALEFSEEKKYWLQIYEVPIEEIGTDDVFLNDFDVKEYKTEEKMLKSLLKYRK